MKKKKNILLFRVSLIIILLIIFVCISAYSYVTAVSCDISGSVFRLHVIANSDSDEDQNLKYKVRDSLLKYMNTLTSNTMCKEEVIEIVNSHLNDFYSIAKSVIESEGYNYNVNVTIGKHDFPTKTYGDVSLPAGKYDSLRIEIGSAMGHNWWCVMFPPLCFVDVTSGIVPDDSKKSLEDSLTDEEYDLITSSEDNSDITIKFKLIEFIENIKIKLAKN